jgi:mevalonate kinase
VYASTGITASTTKVVGDVRALKESRPEWFAAQLEHYKTICADGLAACTAGDWPRLAAAMDANHTLLQELTVSCPELDTLVDTARAAGAIGAKMSGTGRGGLMIALTPGDGTTQERVKMALEAVAPFVWTAEIGGV